MKKKLLATLRVISAILALAAAATVFFMLPSESGGEELIRAASGAIITGLAVFALGIAISNPLAAFVIKPIDPDDKKVSNYEELSPLFRRIEHQRSIIKESASELKGRDYSLRTIMEHMQEGLVLLDGRGMIIAMNRSACRLLDTSESFIGKHIFAASREPGLQAVIHDSLGGSAGETELKLNEKFLHVAASPVWTEGTTRGAVILIFDMTVNHEAQRLRSEFSANVSHELKTPLTSLSGYAEIMKDGLVKQEDMVRFSEKIYNEAKRLIDLTDDIMKISYIDESSGDIAVSDVKLLELAEQTVAALRDTAAQYGVDLRLSGSETTVRGNAQLLSETIYNLCDNAIKYNVPGGSVDVLVENRGGAILTVKDSGIGIPPEHQQRIFERFYRVDESRSKETGGTGLGLSIVKHAAGFHAASVELESAPGLGTSITLRFKNKGENTDVS